MSGDVRVATLGIQRRCVVGGGVVADAGTVAAGLAVEGVGFNAQWSISQTSAK